jgi:hypothetical protein
MTALLLQQRVWTECCLLKGYRDLYHKLYATIALRPLPLPLQLTCSYGSIVIVIVKTVAALSIALVYLSASMFQLTTLMPGHVSSGMSPLSSNIAGTAPSMTA